MAMDFEKRLVMTMLQMDFLKPYAMIRNTLNYFHNKNMPVMKIEGLVFQNAVKYFGSH